MLAQIIPGQIAETATNLAGKDDRYLMIVAVLLLIAGGGFIIRYLANSLEKTSEKQNEQTERLIAVCERNNGVIASNTAILNRVHEKIGVMERVEDCLRTFEKSL